MTKMGTLTTVMTTVTIAMIIVMENMAEILSLNNSNTQIRIMLVRTKGSNNRHSIRGPRHSLVKLLKVLYEKTQILIHTCICYIYKRQEILHNWVHFFTSCSWTWTVFDMMAVLPLIVYYNTNLKHILLYAEDTYKYKNSYIFPLSYIHYQFHLPVHHSSYNTAPASSIPSVIAISVNRLGSGYALGIVTEKVPVPPELALFAADPQFQQILLKVKVN